MSSPRPLSEVTPEEWEEAFRPARERAAMHIIDVVMKLNEQPSELHDEAMFVIKMYGSKLVREYLYNTPAYGQFHQAMDDWERRQRKRDAQRSG